MGLLGGGSGKSKAAATINTDTLINFTPETSINISSPDNLIPSPVRASLPSTPVLSTQKLVVPSLSLPSTNEKISNADDAQTNPLLLVGLGLLAVIGFYFYGK